MLIQNSIALLLNYYTNRQRKLNIPNGLFLEVKFQLDDKIYVTENIRKRSRDA